MSKKRKIHYTISKWDLLKPSLVWRSIKFTYLRMKYGHDPSYFWNLDVTLVELILEFAKRGTEFEGHPGRFNSAEEWHKVLQEIREGCEEYLDYENYCDVTKKWTKAKKLILENWEAFWT